MDLFLDNLLSVINEQKKINKILVKELFNESGAFITAHFLLVRVMIETDLLKSLVEKCEECVPILIEIDQELVNLKQ